MLPYEFKLKDKGVSFFIPIPFTTQEVEITSGKEVNHSQESNDNEEKFRMVVKRKGKHTLEGNRRLCQQDARALKSNRPRQIRNVNWKEISNVLWDLVTMIKDKKKHVA